MRPIIALLTDFGLQDPYVGVMKAVMRRICPDADFIDISHAIQPQNVREAGLALLTAHRYFAAGTIFLVVVDPGVGSARRPIAVQTDTYCFVAPDNGVLSYALDGASVQAVVELSNPDYHLQPVSQTFHGRDIFAPAAAHLATGVSIAMLGAALDSFQRFPAPALMIEKDRLVGEVIHIDHFGNVVTSIGEFVWTAPGRLRLVPRFSSASEKDSLRPEEMKISLGSHLVRGVQPTYSEAPRGEMLALIGSSGFLEIAVNQGDCAARTGASIGDRVEVSIYDAAVYH